MDAVSVGSSEGDTEAQIALPLLTRSEYLGIPLKDIRSKEGLSARDIGKGTKKKIGYIPDFCAYKRSLPIFLIEMKSPANHVDIAYAEARLYAAEINKAFPHQINPCSRILACNGRDLHAGYWDAEAEIKTPVDLIVPGSMVADHLRTIVGNDELERFAAALSDQLRSKDFSRPFNQSGGTAQIVSKIEPNTFAADLAPILRRYFSSRDQSTDEEIYSKAYISSNEVTSYDRILESFLKDRLSKAKRWTEVKTTRRRSEVLTKSLSKFDESRPIRGDIQLVTGSVGVGKSLFARRYKEFLQPPILEKKNHWAFLDFNGAKVDFTLWSDWVCEEFVKSIIAEGAPVDLRNASDQERVFAGDLADRDAYYQRMEVVGEGRGLLERARDIEQWRQDAVKSARGIARYLQGDKADNVIVVFDNVDRRDSEAQLAAFETALWFMEQTRCMVLLQMRDSTFEVFKERPPLDTYRTGQIFHISPPRFVDVVKKRLELSLEQIANEAPEQVRFRTNQGASFVYPKGRAGDFLKGIYAELFQSTNNISRIMEALAGRNVRRALDMFMAILTSGHMPESIIASVAQGGGFRSFPEHVILRSLMRQDYRFFNNNCGFIANIFHCDTRWSRPTNLLIVELLFLLIGLRKIRGDNGQMGFLSMPRLLQEMAACGFVEPDVWDATRFCLAKGLIEVETSSIDLIRENDSIKATASAWAHMRILSSRTEYIAAVLPTTPVDDKVLIARVYDSMQIENRSNQVHTSRSTQLTEAFLIYLRVQMGSLYCHPGFRDRHTSGSSYIIAKIEEALKFDRRETPTVSGHTDLLDT